MSRINIFITNNTDRKRNSSWKMFIFEEIIVVCFLCLLIHLHEDNNEDTKIYEINIWEWEKQQSIRLDYYQNFKFRINFDNLM